MTSAALLNSVNSVRDKSLARSSRESGTSLKLTEVTEGDSFGLVS